MSREVPMVADNETIKRKHEPDAIWARMVASLGIGLLSLVVLALIGIAVAFYVLMPNALSNNAGSVWLEQNLDPGVEPNQAYSRERLLAEEEAFLRQYSWEDKDHGIARIPIDRGIDLMVQRQLKVTWPPAAAGSAPEKRAQ